MLKQMLYLLTFLMMIVTPLMAKDEMSQEEAAVRQILNQYMDAINSHNPKTTASFWSEDGDLINAWGQLATSRFDVEKIASDNFHTKLKDANIKESIEFIRFIKPDVALVDVDRVTTHLKDEKGNELPPITNHGFYVLIKRQGQWQIIASRIYPLRTLTY